MDISNARLTIKTKRSLMSRYSGVIAALLIIGILALIVLIVIDPLRLNIAKKVFMWPIDMVKKITGKEGFFIPGGPWNIRKTSPIQGYNPNTQAHLFNPRAGVGSVFNPLAGTLKTYRNIAGLDPVCIQDDTGSINVFADRERDQTIRALGESSAQSRVLKGMYGTNVNPAVNFSQNDQAVMGTTIGQTAGRPMIRLNP